MYSRLAREYPLPVFFALAYAITWTALAPLVLSETGAAVLPIRVPIEYSVMGGFGPCVAALLTQWLAEGNLRAFRLWSSRKTLLVGATAGPIMVLTAFVLLPGILIHEGAPADLNWAAFRSLAIYNWSTLIGGPLNEEPGWRGYALPRLQASFGPLGASLILGLAWTGWHLPMFLIPGRVSVSLWHYAVITIALTVLMTYAGNLSSFSVVVAALMHAAYNSSSKLLNGLLATARVRSAPSPETLFMLSGLGVAALVLVATRGRLGSSQSRPKIPR